MSTAPAPLWPQPIEIIGVTGEFASGKTLFGITIAPGPRTKVYDTEKSSGSYTAIKFDRVSIPDVMSAAKPAGYKPIDTFTWWWNDVKATPPGKYDVIMIDTISEIEDGLTEWVQKNPTYFGHSSGQYAKMSGIMWGDVKTLWKTILSDLASRCQTFVFCTHMANVWAGDRPTGKRKPKGKETLMELASLYLCMERKPDKDGKMPAKPAALQLKSRLVHTSFDPVTMEVKIVPALPPRLPVCTPQAIREYMNTPPDYENLKEEEKVNEDKLTQDERELMALQKAEAERDAERMRLDRVGQQREMMAEADKKAANTQAAQSQSDTLAAAASATGAGATTNPVCPTPDQLQKLLGLKNHLLQLGGTADEWTAFFTPYGVAKAKELTPAQADEVMLVIEKQVAEKQQSNPKAWE
jgi:hypothetical protein